MAAAKQAELTEILEESELRNFKVIGTGTVDDLGFVEYKEKVGKSLVDRKALEPDSLARLAGLAPYGSTHVYISSSINAMATKTNGMVEVWSYTKSVTHHSVLYCKK